jgi:hypothetical protein
MLLNEPTMELYASYPAKKCRRSTVFCHSYPPPPVVDGGEEAGNNAVVFGQVGNGGCAKLIDGITAPCVVGMS